MRPSSLITATVTMTATLLLSGCSLFESGASNPAPAPPPAEQSDDVDQVVAALAPLASEDALPASDEIFGALEDAGFDVDALEATSDESPLGNEVPAKIVGVRLDEGCVISEIRGAEVSGRLEREVTSTNTCLLGEVDRPEGAAEPTGDPMEEGSEDNGEGHMPDEDINDIPGENPGGGDSGSDESGSGDGGSGDSGSGDSGSGSGESGSGDGGSGDGGESEEGSLSGN